MQPAIRFKEQLLLHKGPGKFELRFFTLINEIIFKKNCILYLPWLSLSNFKICLMMHNDACNMKHVSVTNLQKI